MGEECTRRAPLGEAPLQSSELPALLSTCWLLKVAGNLQTWHSRRRVVRRRERKRREKAEYGVGELEGGRREARVQARGGPERKGVQTEGEGKIAF